MTGNVRKGRKTGVRKGENQGGRVQVLVVEEVLGWGTSTQAGKAWSSPLLTDKTSVWILDGLEPLTEVVVVVDGSSGGHS